MKKLSIIIGLGLLPFLLLSQVPQEFNYQAVVRNAQGVIQKDSIVNFTIDLLQNGTTVYCENHNDLNTGILGIVNFKVGSGDDGGCGDFEDIQWGQGNLKLRVTLNGEPMSLVDIVAVPFAIYAENSGGDGDWSIDSDSVSVNTTKFIGIGTSSPQAELHIIDKTNNSLTETGGILIGNIDNENLVIDRNEIMARNNGSTDRLGLQANGGEIRIHSNDGFPETNVIIQEDGDIGIGTNNPNARLQIKGFSDASASEGGSLILGESGGENLVFDDNEIMARDDGQLSILYLQNNGGHLLIQAHEDDEEFKVGIGVDINQIEDDTRLHVNGMTTTSILKITGGGDVKEDFYSIEKLEPGDIVVIDEKNPGQIRRTDEEYDRKVAGVISGANGIKPGISLSQEDVLEGDYPLTMLGRVYIKVTGNVQIGDMLTTSSKAGYAMSVTDFSKANGTVIGKAMTANEEGDGMVLVLVNLQ